MRLLSALCCVNVFWAGQSRGILPNQSRVRSDEITSHFGEGIPPRQNDYSSTVSTGGGSVEVDKSRKVESGPTRQIVDLANS